MRKEKLISDQKIFPKQLFLIHSWISIWFVLAHF
jgi:hypothetical protein